MKNWIAGFAWGLTLCVFTQAVLWSSLIDGRKAPEAKPYVIEYYIPVVEEHDIPGMNDRLSVEDIQEML
jgi:hypothetical protein